MAIPRSLMHRSGLDEALTAFQYLEVNTRDLELPGSEHLEYAHGGSCSLRIGSYLEREHTRSHVAIKIFKIGVSEEERVKTAKRFVRELEVWATLKHENILPLLGYHVNRDLSEAWLVSELQVNGNILQYTRVEGQHRFSLLEDVLQGLEYLHSKKPPVIHRDIKPGNILVSSGKHVRAMLCDFGLCKETPESVAPGHVTPSQESRAFVSDTLLSFGTRDHNISSQTSGGPQGSCRYMSPELLRELPPPYSTASDMWAWGCTAHQIVTGEAPYASSENESQVVLAILRGRIPSSKKYTAASSAYHKEIFNCWAQSPEDRPSATKCRENLAARPIDEPEPELEQEEQLEGAVWAARKEVLISKLPQVDARYDSTSKESSASSFKGNRLAALQEITDWINDEGSESPLFWLCDQVSVGRSIVAHAIAKEQDARGRLGASFFFSREDAAHHDARLLFPSIAYQLARFNTCFYDALAHALQRNTHISELSLHEQARHLVVEPLSVCGLGTSTALVVVIDGLDESSAPSLLIDSLADEMKKLPSRFRLLLTGRPVASIATKFEQQRLASLTRDNEFCNIDEKAISEDVRTYLEWSLGDVWLSFYGTDWFDWPSPHQMERLIQRTGGLLVVANAYVTFIADAEEKNPESKLNRILSKDCGTTESAQQELDLLYTEVLADVHRSIHPIKGPEMVRKIISMILFSIEKMSLDDLAAFWSVCIPPKEFDTIRRRLKSMLQIPQNPTDPVNFFHSSFEEYIQRSSRCQYNDFCIHPKDAHEVIAVSCMRNLISVAESGITGLEFLSVYTIPIHIRYPGRFLAEHLARFRVRKSSEVQRTTGKLLSEARWTYLQIKWRCKSPLFGSNPWKSQVKDRFDVEKDELREHILSTGLRWQQIFRDNASVIVPHAEEARQAIPVIRGQYQGVLLVVDGSGGPYVLSFRAGAHQLDVLLGLSSWYQLKHPNILDCPKFSFAKEKGSTWLWFPSRINLLGSSGLRSYLRTNALDESSRLSLGLRLAKVFLYLAQNTPVRLYFYRNLSENVMVQEGDVFVYPAFLDRSNGFAPPKRDLIFGASGRTSSIFPPPSFKNNERDLAAADIWCLGTLLCKCFWSKGFRFPRYLEDNAMSDHADYDAKFAEMVIFELLFDLQVSNDIENLLRDCWAYAPEDRPNIQECIRRIEAMIEARQDHHQGTVLAPNVPHDGDD